MKILFITEFFPIGKDLRFSGGVEARTYFVAKHLAKRHQITVICSRQIGSKRLEKMDGITVHRVGPDYDYIAGGVPRFSQISNLITNISFIISAINFGSKLNIDIVDGGNFIGHFIAKQIAQKINCPVIFWYPDVFIGQWIETSGIAGLTGWILEKFNLARTADHFIAISKITSRKLQNNGVFQKDISVIPCGVDLNEFSIRTYKSTIPNIICISRLVHYKRIADLIWAFALLLKNRQNLRFTVVGQGPDEKRLKNLCQMLKISKKITFLNNLPRENLIKTLKSVHIFCLPSEVEGFGITIIEAAAAGVPYVVSDIDVFKEVTKNGQGGLIFKLGNIKDLATKLEKLLTDKNLYAKKSSEGLNLAQNYQWSQVAHQTEILYKSLHTKKAQWRKNGISLDQQ